MAFCSFLSESASPATTSVDNRFIFQYMPGADPMAVKVYLFGLALCSNREEFTLADLAEKLSISEEEAQDAFLFWEQSGLVQIASRSPFLVKYSTDISRTKKVNPARYTSFNLALQSIFPDHEFTYNEFRDYMEFLEEYPLQQNALIAIAQYCKEYTGNPHLPFKYVRTTALGFIQKGLLTERQVQAEIAHYSETPKQINTLFKVLGIRRRAEIADSDLLTVWLDMQFDFDTILFVASRMKKGAKMERLDSVLKELYRNRCISREEIEGYLNKKDLLYTETFRIARKLGVYLSLAETYVEKYTSRWDAMGYTAESLEAIADYAFAVRKRSFEEMDEIIGDWYRNGIVSTESIADHLRSLNEEESFLTTLLKTCALSRRPIDSDRMTVAVWREWGFSDEMILAAARESVGKANPIPYTGAILSSWKTKKIFSPQEIPSASSAKGNPAPSSPAQRTTKEEMGALLAEVAKRYQS